MMIEIKVPALSESVSEGTLLSWHKQEGEAVAQGENLIDLETDKVVLELPAPQSGVLSKIVKQNGEVVRPGEVLALIDTEARAAAPAKAAAVEPALSPSVRKLVAEHELDPAQIEGSGRGGRITREDVLAQLEKPAQPASTNAPLPAPSGERPEQRVPMTRLRARVAERLVQAQQTAAILTTFNEVNMQPVMDLRARYKEKFEKDHGIKLGFMSFFVKATVAALKKFPVVNASVDGSDIIYHGYFDIGIAVGSPRGLVVPVVRDADQLSFAEIEKQIAEYGSRARDGKLTIEELTGGTFSISNGGVFGSMMSTPILNPPQSAILGMHKTYERPIAENGQVVIRPMMYLALSYDHRIVDGREAVLFLVAIKEALEDPARLLLGV
ncbi:MAG: 2-oxoglutarate dehydrogenase complex dihydrolipoyllysine-residue succinyltransferase [Sulfurimicrobium sp.]|jgi:2-oxoglutarate dehydrogenase E2 component (dihydrolipoamide succinyltransferase)|nr:2-oxoglutarate dehydrogenase complex dihydrolipoyllysine-residue succinyltransferase [Sulfurimicrobium sp.]MDP1703283.1 2-oxoglutarate dehydrogenase complex dihydrolipoyllysine-residue succinyltransferase [Sulfurimicrobium sp.]MDP2199904.1 2-oxoglutarate dehydrogenase complex dihydrolipoyllysine-residue succinyltransferase [Sulfurimicrobium sp.]MDP2963141.1 2-oxoglutarate dehydrogenase complex dihydrolipoyllysine-residue succinyltransferase [Sulfurimicrobium sp.]MDP3689144.1 2-oxoglutarate d